VHVFASQIPHLQAQYSKFFVYYYLNDIPSNDYDKNYVSLVHQFGSGAKFFLSNDHEFIKMMNQAHAPSVLAFSKDQEEPKQMPVSILTNPDASQEWALETLYPFIAPVTSANAQLILAGKKLVFLSIVDLQGSNSQGGAAADASPEPGSPAFVFEANLKPILKTISKEVRTGGTNVRFAYIDGVQFAPYVKRVYSDVNNGDPLAALPIHLLVDPTNEVYYVYDTETRSLDPSQVKQYMEDVKNGNVEVGTKHGTWIPDQFVLSSFIRDTTHEPIFPALARPFRRLSADPSYELMAN
jgi:hypothetical protein